MSSIRLQEILTRAVVGRCDRRVVWTQTAPADGADCVLGVHVSQPQLHLEEGPSGPQVALSAVCEVWCSTGDETRVERIACAHTEPADVPLVARVVGETETTGRLLRGARCLEAEVREGLFHLTLEMHIALEAVGVARLWVKAFDLEDGVLPDEDAFDSGTSDSSLSVEELTTDGEPEPGAEAWAEPETWTEPESWKEPDPWAEPAPWADAEPWAEAEPTGDADRADGTETGGEEGERLEAKAAAGGGSAEMAYVVSASGASDRDARRTRAAVARFRGPSNVRISIIQ